MRPAHPVRHRLCGDANQLSGLQTGHRRAASATFRRACRQPPVPAKSRTLRNVLVIAAAVVVLAGLVTGGWFGYSKIKFHRNPVINTPNLLGYWRFSPDTPTKSSFGTNLAFFSGNAVVGSAGSGRGGMPRPFCSMATPLM